jgi:hypothetical protein
MNNYHQNHGGNPTDAIAMPSRVINHSVPIKLFSGMTMVGPVPAREYGRHTTLVWSGGSGSSQFIFPSEGQSGQGYPSDGSPRDGSFINILFQGGSSTHCIQYFDVHTNAYSGHTLWYWLFRDCGWRYFQTVWNGWGDGVVIDGIPHLQAINKTAFAVGGSENRLFGGGYGLQDAQPSNWSAPGQPQLHCHSSRLLVSDAMLSARGDCYGLLIDYGYNIYVDGLAVDAPDSAPHFGASIKVTGGNNITLDGISLKGGMHNPSGATGGLNRGVIDISGGSNIVLSGINALRQGTNAPSSTPVVYVAAAAKGVFIHSINCFGYDGIIKAEQPSNVFCLDPRLKVVQA